MTIAEYIRNLKELTYEFEHTQGILISAVSIVQNEDEMNELDVAITMEG